MARVQALRTASGKKFSVEAKALKSLKVNFRDLVKTVRGERNITNIRLAGIEISNAFVRAGHLLRDKAREYAASSGSARRLFSGARPAIFAFSDFQDDFDDKRKRSALVGVRTGLHRKAMRSRYSSIDKPLYIEWGVKRGTRRKKDNSLIGTLHSPGALSMSFGRLFESGTANGRVKPRNYFRNAIRTSRGPITKMIVQAYSNAIERFNRLKHE